MENFGYYIFCLVAIVVAFIVVKKITGCLIKAALLLAVVVALAAIYWMYFMN